MTGAGAATPSSPEPGSDAPRLPEPALAELEVSRTARYARLGEVSDRVRELWVVLHGYRQLAARFLRRFRPIADPHRHLVAPEALNRFYVGDPSGRHGPEARVGATWMTREARESEIRDYVGWLEALTAERRAALEEAGCSEPRVVALGFSQGAHTAARWASLGRARIDELILWGEGLPHDFDAERARTAMGRTTVHLVRGEADAFHPAARVDGDREALEALGVPVRVWTHPGGHRIEEGLLRRMAAEMSG